ncbi:MAG TPA: serine/threonine-protein kinase, partial [Anaeromyxobacteraceae bacterium]|nr:serine/threonine-protein kinase [Anaeromyxobacteraceae bacterium]
EERGARPGETRDAAGAAEPGTVSRLLLEIAQASEEKAAQSWREALRPGDAVGRYQIRREIGRGGFGAVYEAFDPQLGRVVALKALKPGRTRRIFSEEWIQKEAEAVAKLDHPAIVTIFDVGTCPAGAYLVMELLQGETLAERLAKGPLPVDEALRVAEQMAEGLAHAHSRGVLHRDLKPANVFVCSDGRVKLLDFGLAHLLGTDGSSGAGTPAYMAPEQAAGAAVDERADVYAAAMVLGEMLTGRRPVERATPRGPSAEPPSSKTELMWEGGKATAADGAAAEGPKLDGVPRPVTRVVRAALSANPEERPRDGRAWLAELRAARRRFERPRRARRVALLAGVGAAVGLLVAAAATWRLWERQVPGGRITVAVADFANETGERELDGLSGLLITSLEQSSALRVLTRSRMFDVLKQLGKGEAERIDETLAREVGKHSRVRALLLASVRKAGDGYLVEMRALDPLVDEYVFTTKDRAASRREVLDLIDRLGATTRAKLGAGGDSGSPPAKVAELATPNLAAFDLIFRSRRALDLAKFEEAYQLAGQALALDPDSPLARYQAWITTDWRLTGPSGWDKRTATRDALASAEALADRLPERERSLLRLERAFYDRKPELVDPLCERLTSAFPLDKEILTECGTFPFHYYYSSRDRAVGYLERALQLDPGYAPAILKLTWVLQTLGGAEEKLGLLRQLAAAATEPPLMNNLAAALLTARAEDDGFALLERSRSAKGWPFPHPFLALYHAHVGRPEEAEAMTRTCLASLPRLPEAQREGTRQACTTILFESLTGQGRRREALEALGGRTDLTALDAAVHRIAIHSATGVLDDARTASEQLAALGVNDDPETARWAANWMVEGGLVREAASLFAQARSSQHWEGLAVADRIWAEAMAALA